MSRLVNEGEAAAACGITVATFRHLVETGRLPRPLPDIGLYDLKAIDAAIDRLSGLGGPSPFGKPVQTRTARVRS